MLGMARPSKTWQTGVSGAKFSVEVCSEALALLKLGAPAGVLETG